MTARRARAFLWDLLVRGLRFFYLLWGGTLLGTMAAYNRVRVPNLFWGWPAFARFLTRPWGRGLLLGLGAAMALASLLEARELVDRLLVRFMHDVERER